VDWSGQQDVDWSGQQDVDWSGQQGGGWSGQLIVRVLEEFNASTQNQQSNPKLLLFQHWSLTLFEQHSSMTCH
jgi:hypothetical protein